MSTSREGTPKGTRSQSPDPRGKEKEEDEDTDTLPPPTWSEVSLMMKNMETMGKTLIAVQEKLTSMTTSSGKTGKFNEPSMFTGQATAVPGFVQSIKDTLYLQRHIYTTDMDKCIYMSTYFSPGLAREWYNAVLKLNPDCLNNFDNFLTAFIKNFGDSNLVASAQKKLDKLFQTGPASQYAAKFMDHIVYLDVTEASKIFFFTRHLKPRIKDAIALVTDDSQIPKTLKEYMDWIIRIDNCLHEREVDTQHEFNSASTSTSFNKKNEGFLGSGFSNGNNHGCSNNHPPSYTPTLPQGEPMEIDATKTGKPQGPLTAEERQRRKDKGLCMYCGGSGHKANNCPNMSEKAKKTSMARQNANPKPAKAGHSGKA